MKKKLTQMLHYQSLSVGSSSSPTSSTLPTFLTSTSTSTSTSSSPTLTNSSSSTFNNNRHHYHHHYYYYHHSYFSRLLKQFFFIFSITGLVSIYLIANYRQFSFDKSHFTRPPVDNDDDDDIKHNATITKQNHQDALDLLLDPGPVVEPNYAKQYLINTPQCVIPSIPVLDKQTQKLYKKFKSKRYKCDKPDVTMNIQRVNFTKISIKDVPRKMKCSAREILRKASSEDAILGKEVFDYGPNQTVMDFPQSDAIEITCDEKHKRIVPLIPFKQPIWELVDTNINLLNLESDPTSVLMVGIDSVSRLNFLRHFEETQRFISTKPGHSSSPLFEGPLYGLQKVGDNTWPNLMAMFTGEPQSDWNKALPQNRKLDRLPLIFKSFSSAGYLTTYIEDMPRWGLWTYHQKNGFTTQPIEYFLRPVNVMVYSKMNHRYCYKEKLEMEVR